MAEKFKVEEGWNCYECGRPVRIVLFESGSRGIMHQEPKCDDFKNLPTEQYMMRTMTAIKRSAKNVGIG